ncbi:hypothetical protein MANES_04G048209v8 [Manihot esculenta]|nr:hypothetical protein MANES_04G048209v8 [Manihot esculenta]
MEGPIGVMKKLQALWHILELTDREIFAHLSRIGAESLHFAFRMLMVLFRQELSFHEALQLWEMMWAADFDESFTCDFEENYLEALVLHLPRDSGGEMKEIAEIIMMVQMMFHRLSMEEHSLSENTAMKSASAYPFCGLTRNFWLRSDRMQISIAVSSTKNGDDDSMSYPSSVLQPFSS